MRGYMIKSHREFLEYFGGISCIRMFIVSMMPEGEGIDGETGSIVTLIDKQQQSQHQPLQHSTSSPVGRSDAVHIQQRQQQQPISNTTNTNHADILHALSETPIIDGVYDQSNTNNNNITNTNSNGTGYISSGDSDKELLFNPDNEEDEVNPNPPQINTTAPASEPVLIPHTSVQASINNNNNNDNTTTVPPATATATAYKADNNKGVSVELWSELRESYNDCVSNLQRFRSSHINIVAEVRVCILGIYCVMCVCTMEFI